MIVEIVRLGAAVGKLFHITANEMVEIKTTRKSCWSDGLTLVEQLVNQSGYEIINSTATDYWTSFFLVKK